MPTTESVRNASIAPDRASLQLQSDGSSPKGKNKHKLANFAKRILNGSEQGEYDERDGDGVLKKTFRIKKSKQGPHDNRPSVPLKDEEPTMIPDYTPPGETNTPIYTQLAKVKSGLASGADELLDQTEQDNLLAKILFLEGEVEQYRSQRDQANIDCSGLQNSIGILRGERDGFREKHANLHTMYAKLDIDAGALQKERDQLQIENARLLSNVSTLRAEKEALNKEYRQLESDMEKKARDARQAKRTFDEERDRMQRYNEVVEGLNAQVKTLETKLKDQSVVLQLVKQERDNLQPLRASFDNLDAKYKAVFEQHDRCKADLLNTQQQYEDIQGKHRSACDELNRIKLESISTLGDDFFIQNFYHLRSAIRQWTDSYFRGPEKRMWPSQSPKDQKRIHFDLIVLSADAQDMLLNSDSGIGRSRVCEAWLWKFIEEQIFDGNTTAHSRGMYWANSVRADLCRVEKFLRPDPSWPEAQQRMFYKWKASTVKLLINQLRAPKEQGRIPISPDIMDYLVHLVLEILKPWMTGDRLSCIRDLEAIIQLAIDFDSHMNEQWSNMYVIAKPSGFNSRYDFPFNNLMMEGLTKDTQIFARDNVGLVISPALIRSGTASGDNYDRQWVLVKSKVIPQGFTARSQRPKNDRAAGMVTRSLQSRSN